MTFQKEVIQSLATLTTDVGHIKTKVNSMDETLNGNGKVGIKVEVDRLKQFKKLFLWIVGALFVGIVSYGIGYGISLL